MELLTPEVLQPLGVSAVLAVFLYLAWQKLQKKDDRIKELTDNLAEKYEQNTRVEEKLAGILDNNTKTMEKVLERFESTMRNR